MSAPDPWPCFCPAPGLAHHPDCPLAVANRTRLVEPAPPRAEAEGDVSRWRVGRTLGRTLYRDDVCVGMVDTPMLAEEIVVALTGADAVREACAKTCDAMAEDPFCGDYGRTLARFLAAEIRRPS